FARDEQGNYDAVTVQVVTDDPAACRVFGFCRWNQGEYWFENGKRQGLYGDPRNITDRLFNIERGREIYDPESDGWYWLDADSVGKKATSKEVWIPYIYQNEKPGSTEGKWVRYDQNGKMIKGWLKVEDYTAFEYPDQIHNVYYYDEITGAMLKGRQTIDGIEYEFDELTGVLKDRMGEQ
ncbi:MAG: hypothetical protein IKD69_15385, partial [Solobacterium sp.]|nr:hypothetical protein [Solobacterium sp.]